MPKITWLELTESIITCQRCPLSQATTPVPGMGNRRAAIAIVGMAPGAVEERQQTPFVGRSGELLNHLLDLAGLRRASMFLTNTVHCRPKEEGHNRDPLPFELIACRPWLDQELDLLQPKVVVLMGKTAIPIGFPGMRPSEADGLVRAVGGRVYVASYHPAYALRQPSFARNILAALRLAKELTDDSTGI